MVVQRPGPGVALPGAVRNHIVSAAILAALTSFASACAQVDDGDVLDDEGTAVEWPTTQTERIWVEGRSTAVAGSAGAVQAGDGACACTTSACFHQWVVDNVGCDVCVAFVCDGDTVAQSCMACEDGSINPGEAWDGDGRLE